jgi:hypothetical protein
MYLVTKDGQALEVKRIRPMLAGQPPVAWCPNCDVSSQLVVDDTSRYSPCKCGGEYFDSERVEDALAQLKETASLLSRQADQAAEAVISLEDSLAENVPVPESKDPLDPTVYHCNCGASQLKETGRKTHEKTKGHQAWLSKQEN